MNSLSVLGKYLDQPLLVKKFSNAMPAVLIGGGGLYAYQHLKNTPQENSKKETIKTALVLSGTIASALVAPRIAKKAVKIFKSKAHVHSEHGTHCHHGHHGHHEHHNHSEHELPSLKKIKEKNTKLINNFLNENKVSEKTAKILETAKEKVLGFSKVKILFSELKDEKSKVFLNKFIPNPENIDSKHIFGEILELSTLGLVPVVGGIAGGIIGDKLTEENWKERIPNKIKEGSYQYLANIFLCNVGAGAALWGLEKAKVESKTVRAVGMIGGIVATGILGGSAIANFIGKKCIDPLFKHKHDTKIKEELYSERVPEMLDVGLHVDDIATVAAMSGLKWIVPALPALYSISGFRAGIGYRNGAEK